MTRLIVVFSLIVGSVGAFVAPATAAPPRCAGHTATIIGTRAPDRLVGTSGRDVIVGRGGADIILGLGGDDVICGGGGDDSIDGGPGNDVILGNAGDDYLDGAGGIDQPRGGPGADQCKGERPHSCAVVDGWAMQETFDGSPASPSQALLPRSFDYSVTHRTHPGRHFDPFPTYLADHGDDCNVPGRHEIRTSHLTNGDTIDESFFVCRDHMMSSMGDVEGYSMTSFWPRQEFDFSTGGTLEFDVNVNGPTQRVWWEVLIMPADQMRVAAARSWLPISETYPTDHILIDYTGRKAGIKVNDALDVSDWRDYDMLFPDDPARTDRRMRRTMRVRFDHHRITWSIQGGDGSWETFNAALPDGLPFSRGIVMFTTHAYTPTKDGNTDNYTFHWDNIRFSGPVRGLYDSVEADGVVYLEANGDRSIGESDTMTVTLDEPGTAPRLFAQVHNPKDGQVLLSVNGHPEIEVRPDVWMDEGRCSSSGWSSIRVPLDPAHLVEGENELTWTIGPRPACATSWLWDGFSVKEAEIQFSRPTPGR